MNDQIARDQALDTSKSFIVQAPAGSGKTELLAQRILALLAKVDEPEEVLALTFTNKAAAEMRDRIAQALELAAQSAEDLPAHRQLTRSLGSAVLERSDARGWAIAKSMHRLQISTVDAFNRRLVGRSPLSAPVAATGKPCSEPTAWHFYTRAARRVLEWLDDSDHRVDEIFAHMDYDAVRWQRDIATLLQYRDQWLPLTGVQRDASTEGLRDRLESSIDQLVVGELETVASAIDSADLPVFEALLGRARERLHADGRGGVLAELTRPPMLRADSACLADWRALASVLLTGEGKARKQLNVTIGFKKADCADDHEMLSALIAKYGSDEQFCVQLFTTRTLPEPVLAQERWERFVALLQTLPLAVAELNQQFAAAGQADFVEVAIAALGLLGNDEQPGDLALLLDYRLRHILIDEMQDTSASQYELLTRLTAGWQPGDGRTLFVVGDPMQSIYSFRQAEVGLFVRAMQAGIGDVVMESLTLTRNFRSAPTVVEWNNRVFGAVFPPQSNVDTGRVKFSPSASALDANSASAVTVVGVEDGERHAEAMEIVHRLTEELDSEASSIAILVRSRGHLVELLPALRDAGIDYRAEELEHLTDRPEIQTIYALTMALLHEGDRLSWLAVLRGPWLGFSLAELEEWLRSVGDVGSIWRQMRAPEALDAVPAALRDRFKKTCEAIAVARTSRHRSVVERLEQLWFALGVPATLESATAVDNVYEYFDLLRELGVDEPEFEPTRLADALGQKRVLTTGGEQTRVVVMTIHKSKGLEFDTVILPGLGRAPRASTDRLMNWHTVRDVEGEGTTLISLASGRDTSADDLFHNYLGSIAKQRSLNELDRLLYVAATRARLRLVLLGSHRVDEDGKPKSPPKGSLQASLWPALKTDFAATIVAATDVATSPTSRVAVTASAPEPFRDDAAERLAIMPRVRLRTIDTPVEYQWVGSLGRGLGTAVHQWLQRLAGFATPAEAKAFHERSQSARSKLLLAAGVQREELALAETRFEQAIAACLQDKEALWILFGDHQTSQQEFALAAVEDGQLTTVVIDQMFVDHDGAHWLVDYKTSAREGGDRAGFIEQQVLRYTPQMHRYQRIYKSYSGVDARLALYFPLLRQFVELASL